MDFFQNYQKGHMENIQERHNKERINERTDDQNQDPEMNLEDKKDIQKDSTHGNM